MENTQPDYTALIVAILQSFAQYGPALVKSIMDLIHGTPKTAGETDDAYVLRLKAEITAKGLDTTQTDALVENG